MHWLAVLFAAMGLAQLVYVVDFSLRERHPGPCGQQHLRGVGYMYLVALEFVLAMLCFGAAFVLLAR